MTILKKQGVAWTITAVMIVAAIAIGLVKHAITRPNQGQVSPDTAYCIYDDAGVLSYFTLSELVDRNVRLMERYGVAIGVVTCNYGRNDLGNYAMDYAEDMGLSSYDFIVMLDISGDNYWLIQGYDLVNYFTDDDCSDYAYEYMERDFAQGNYDDAVLSLTNALENWYDNVYFSQPHEDLIHDQFRR